MRRNNWKGFDPGNEGGGCKFVNSDGVRVVNVESYESTGPGWWFDWSNRNFEVTGCTFHGNRGLKADWEGAGLFSEANDGPGRSGEPVRLAVAADGKSYTVAVGWAGKPRRFQTREP